MERWEGTTVATEEANANGVAASGQVRRDGSRYLVVVDGQIVGAAGSLAGAAHRLAEQLRSRLPRPPRSWGLEVHCLTTPVGLVYGNRRSGGAGGGPVDGCLARAIVEYRRGEDNLERALESAARLLTNCCG